MKPVLITTVLFVFSLNAFAQRSTFGSGFGSRPGQFAPRAFRQSKFAPTGATSRFGHRESRLSRLTRDQGDQDQPSAYVLNSPGARIPKVRTNQNRNRTRPATTPSAPFLRSAYPAPTPISLPEKPATADSRTF